MRRQANEEAIKLLTSRFAPGAPSSIAGGSMSMGLPDPADFAEVGPTSSTALVCHPGTAAASDQAGTSRALVCLGETDLRLDQAGPSAGADHPMPSDHVPPAEPVVDKGRAGQPPKRRAKSTRAGRKGGTQLGSDNEQEEEEWQSSEENFTDSDDEYVAKRKKARKKKGTARGGTVGAPKKRGRPPKASKASQGMGLDAGLEAEFALALLESENVQQIVQALQIANAELPAYNVQQARDLLAQSKVSLLLLGWNHVAAPDRCFWSSTVHT